MSKNKIECSAIYLGKTSYKMFLSRYDNRSGQFIKWEENSDHAFKINVYNGFTITDQIELPIFRLDGSILPLLKQVVSAEYYKKGYSGENLEKFSCAIKTLVLKLKSEAQIHLHEFKLPNGSSYGSIETLELKDYPQFETLNNISN